MVIPCSDNQINRSVFFNSSNCLIDWWVDSGRSVEVMWGVGGQRGVDAAHASTSPFLHQKVKNSYIVKLSRRIVTNLETIGPWRAIRKAPETRPHPYRNEEQ